MKIDKQTLSLCCGALAIIIAFQIFIQIKNQDINFCRNLFAQLVKGLPTAAKSIDWEIFKALDVDVAKTYNAISNPKEKFGYQDAFIKGFSFGFSGFKGKLKAFAHWRIYEKSRRKVVVACDYLGYNKTLLFTLSKAGAKRKLIALDWRK